MTGAKTRCIFVRTHGCSISSCGSDSTPAAQVCTHFSFLAFSMASAALSLSPDRSRSKTRSIFLPALRIWSASSGASFSAHTILMRPPAGFGSTMGKLWNTTASDDSTASAELANVATAPPAAIPDMKSRRDKVSFDMVELSWGFFTASQLLGTLSFTTETRRPTGPTNVE